MNTFLTPVLNFHQTFATGAVLIFLHFFATPASGQFLTSCFPATGSAGTSVALTIEATGSLFSGATGAVLQHEGCDCGPTSYSTSFTVISPTVAVANFDIAPSMPPGFYDINLLNAGTGGTSFDNNLFSIIYSGGVGYGWVTGKAFIDDDGDCVKDAAETPLTGYKIEASPGPYYTITGTPNGSYGFWLPIGTYTLSAYSDALHTHLCPAPSYTHTVNVTTPGAYYPNKNFGYDLVDYIDLTLWGSGQTVTRPGFNAWISIYCKNHGSIASTPSRMSVELDPNLNFVSSTPSPDSVSGSKLYFDVPALMPDSLISPRIQVSLPASVPLGTHLLTTVNVPQLTDFNPASNTNYPIEEIVVGSYDPNDKAVATPDGRNAEPAIDAVNDSVLFYKIRFQNTGTYLAENIFITDTLDPNLDPATFEPLGASHTFTSLLSGDGHLRFTFPHINLPDSFSNEPASHGYVRFKIETRPGLPAGTIIENKAAIYFDYNPPIITNTTSTLLCENLAVPGFTYALSAPPRTVQFTDVSSGSPYSWFWDFGDPASGAGNTSVLQNPVHTFSANEVYTICLTITDSCHSSTTCQTLLGTGVSSEDSFRSSFSVHPNPASETLTVNGFLAVGGIVSLTITDISGKIILPEKQLVSDQLFRHTFNVHALPSGMYLMQIRYDGGSNTVKFIKD